ncbi:MAG: response regulator [Planctomycetaceae bacterium]
MSLNESLGAPQRCRILVMDDEPLVREAIAMLLKSMQYDVLDAATGEEALQILRELPPTDPPLLLIALLDLTVLHGQGGHEIIDPLRQEFPDVKAVVMTGRQDDPLVANFEEHGFVAVLSKPFQAKDLSELIQRLCDMP